MFETRTHRLAAAAVAVLYIAIQSFQSFVFTRLPEAEGTVQALLQGPLPLNLARATLMLLSFFGLAYLYLVACGLAFRRKPLAAVAAFLGFFAFCLLELQLRSVELFYVYLELPKLYQAATAAGQVRVLEIQSVFQAVQHALYFPLGLAQALGSIALCAALGGHRFDWLARLAFGLNAARLLLRSLDVYVLGTRFDTLYSVLYLPLVYVIFGATVAWLCLRRET
ncbi:hypothetical protein RHOFW510R12_14000 [Rhodanobacter sp. FW510-R12]|uniref:hypothetical protein n=1 Tax=unclassified Rhodanobacter TaxID=2621553 RepID=UPI0007AA4DDC|nr:MULTISPECIES: hypothetical protein [unclassified Rhodanobacter]KZC17230.1 hypothetical protein RHOFW104R8_12280 [Rhodanobacter sp. FW104-R8]KZC29086.1 hypothetical protein RhoFW510T8_07990 [Rhodanobacter sp. FW510-T8]KZC33024.1 hypothetical protein RhoFW510R10_09845 [Rhodanobacter sp. FW510-R10]